MARTKKLQIVRTDGVGEWSWRLISENGKNELARSSETYVGKRTAIKSAESVTGVPIADFVRGADAETPFRLNRDMTREYVRVEVIDERRKALQSRSRR